jgi:hypothetical protein
MNSTKFVFWLYDTRIATHQAIDYFCGRNYSNFATTRHLAYLLTIKNYFMSFLNPDRWETPKAEVQELRQMAAECTSFDELDDLRELLMSLGIDPIEPRGW